MNKKSSIEKIVYTVLIALFSVLRVIVGVKACAYFLVHEYWDDALLARYSEIIGHFRYPNVTSIIKYMGYPFFLAFCGISHIPYTVLTSAIWLIMGYLAYIVVRKLKAPRVVAFLTFLYFSFIPEAFERVAGLRIYRNSVIGPFAGISLLLMVLVFLKIGDSEHKKGTVALALITGLVTSYTYYIKEDGAWLLACLLAAMVMWLVKYFVTFKATEKKKRISGAVAIFIPILCFLLVTAGYKAINYRFFGVAITNSRSGGESGKFLSNIYAIESENRTAEIWAPVDAIEKAFEASETLSSHPELWEAIVTSDWMAGDIYNNPVYGDFLGWVMMSAGPDCGLWSTDAEKEAFFKQVNEELAEAFKEGRLKKQTGRITLLPSAGSRSLDEVLALKDEINAAFQGAVFYKDYLWGITVTDLSNLTEEESYTNANMADTLGLSYINDYSGVVDEANSVGAFYSKVAGVYSYVNVILIIACLMGLIIQLIDWIKSGKGYFKAHMGTLTCFLMTLAFAGIGFLYAFAIGWFSSFLHRNGIIMQWINYYNVALPILLALSYMFAVIGLSRLVSGLRKN